MAWLGLVLGAPVSLEAFVVERLFLRALSVIAPHATGSVAPGDEVAVFDRSMQALNRSELHYPPNSPLLRIDWPLLMAFGETDVALSQTQRREAIKVAKLLLGAAVKCHDRARFVVQIQNLAPAAQKALMVIMQQELLKETAEEPQPEGEERMRARIAELEAAAAERDELARQIAELLTTCASLEKALQESRQVTTPASSGKTAIEGRNNEELKALRDRVRMLQDEMRRTEEENLQLTAVAAEAGARVRENRQLRDELDLARENVAKLEEQLQEATAEAVSIGAAERSLKEMSLLREQLKASQIESMTHRDAASKLRSDMAQLRSEFAQLESDKNEHRAAEAQFKAQLERTTASFIESKARIGELTVELEGAKHEIVALKNAQPRQVNAGAFVDGGPASLADEIGEPLEMELSVKNEQLRLLEEERDQLLQDLKRAKSAKSSGVAEDAAVAQLRTEVEQLRAGSKATTEQLKAMSEQLKVVERERDELRQLKQAKDKPAPTAASPASVVSAGPCGHELELKVMAAGVHAVGLEIVRLRSELRTDKTPDPGKHNGLLNHLRHAIDPY